MAIITKMISEQGAAVHAKNITAEIARPYSPSKVTNFKVRHHLVRHLDAQYQNIPNLRQGIAAVGRLHGHFYNSDLPAERLTAFIHDAETFLTDLFNLPETLAITQA